MDSSMPLEITVHRTEEALSELCSLKPEQILLAEVHTSNSRTSLRTTRRSVCQSNGFLCAFEVPVPGSPTSLCSPTLTDATELYFLSSHKNRPSLFGMPLIVPCHRPHHDAYGYQYPFTLRFVGKDGNSCAWCPWYSVCENAYIAVDWDPTALHLRYHPPRRGSWRTCSVEQSRRAQAEPISLDSCLKAFTSEEELAGRALLLLQCKTHRLATKKLTCGGCRPLIVHPEALPVRQRSLDQIPEDRQVPTESFDPSAFLAPRPGASLSPLRTRPPRRPAGIRRISQPTSSPSSPKEQRSCRPGRLRLLCWAAGTDSPTARRTWTEPNTEAEPRDTRRRRTQRGAPRRRRRFFPYRRGMTSESSCSTEASSSHCDVS
ncbi:hypothetical protein INR49_020434 [Caranx melampygus]|nr:hypothetical protein INR49_020434 [Caranx melampygus]